MWKNENKNNNKKNKEFHFYIMQKETKKDLQSRVNFMTPLPESR